MLAEIRPTRFSSSIVSTSLDLALPGVMRRHFHFRQDVKGAEHQLRQLMLTDQAVDPCARSWIRMLR